jgi:hypothetical protein
LPKSSPEDPKLGVSVSSVAKSLEKVQVILTIEVCGNKKRVQISVKETIQK